MARLLLFATLRDKYGVREVRLNWSGGPLKRFVEEASRKLGGDFYREVYRDGRLRDDRIIMIDGRNVKDIKRRGVDEPYVPPEGTVAVFPPLAGG